MLALLSVETLLMSETIDEKILTELEDLATKTGAEIYVISVETREGTQLKDLGGIAAILRCEI